MAMPGVQFMAIRSSDDVRRRRVDPNELVELEHPRK